MHPLRLALLTLLALALAAHALGAPPALIEVQVGQKKYEGKVAANNRTAFWLVAQDGRMRSFDTEAVKSFRQLSPQFQGWSPSLVKDQLRREFTRPYDVASSRHYVVVAKGDAKARLFADVLEEYFSTFRMYFSLRGFKVPEPEFPMIALIFPSQDAFQEYARQERQQMPAMVRGYYLSTSNRIAFFETDADGLAAAPSPPREAPVRLAPLPPFLTSDFREGSLPQLAAGIFPEEAVATDRSAKPASSDAWYSIEASLKDTLIHEATHQAAYNTGLHSRIGENPLWTVEGLATVLEAPGVRNARANTGVKSRINPERYVWFGNFVKERRQPQSLEAFIAGDDLFQKNALDAYSQAWALTFFLFETRPRNYADYLRTIASRNPLESYTPEARVADFQRTISKELKLLEAEFLRYMAEIR